MSMKVIVSSFLELLELDFFQKGSEMAPPKALTLAEEIEVINKVKNSLSEQKPIITVPCTRNRAVVIVFF